MIRKKKTYFRETLYSPTLWSTNIYFYAFSVFPNSCWGPDMCSLLIPAHLNRFLFSQTPEPHVLNEWSTSRKEASLYFSSNTHTHTRTYKSSKNNRLLIFSVGGLCVCVCVKTWDRGLHRRDLWRAEIKRKCECRENGFFCQKDGTNFVSRKSGFNCVNVHEWRKKNSPLLLPDTLRYSEAQAKSKIPLSLKKLEKKSKRHHHDSWCCTLATKTFDLYSYIYIDL